MDDNSPATKGDLRKLLFDLSQEFATKSELRGLRAETQQGFDYMNKRFDRLDAYVTQILDVLVNVDNRAKADHKDHEYRMRILEKLQTA